MHPIRFDVDGAVPPLQKQDVRDDFRARVGAKGVVRQPDRAQQFGALRDVLAHLRGLLIHRVAGSHKGDYAAGAHLIQRFGEKVVVNGKTELVVSPVVDLVIAEGHVADSKVEEVPSVRRLKARDGDIGLGVKLPRDTPCDAVQLHTVQAAVLHGLRQQAEEIPHAHGGFQDVAAGKAHLRDGIVHGPDDHGAGIVRVERRGARRFIFLRRQRSGKFTVFPGPRGLLRVKGIRQTAPAHIPREYALLLRRGHALLGFQSVQQVNGLHVSLKFDLCAAFAQVIIRNAEIRWNKRSNGFIHRFGEILWKTLWIRLWRTFTWRIFGFGEIGGVALIAGQQPQKVFPALRTQNRIAQRGVLQLDIERPDLGDDKGRILQIDGIAHLAGKRLIHALPVIRRGYAFIGRRCVFQRLHPAGKRLHFLNEGAGVQRVLIHNLPVHNSRLC